MINAYSLAYRWLPYMVELFEQGKITLENLINTDYLYTTIKSNGIKIMFDWNCFKSHHVKVSQDLQYILYCFPKPQNIPEAKFSMVVIQTSEGQNKATYYTLEASFKGKWVLGGQDTSCHYNYGTIEGKPTMQNFIETVFCKFYPNTHLCNYPDIHLCEENLAISSSSGWLNKIISKLTSKSRD